MPTPFRTAACLFLFGLAAVHAENLIQNGDFSEKRRDWKVSHGSIEEEGENKFLVLEPSASRGASLAQQIDVPEGVRDLRITFKYKFSEGFKSRVEFQNAQCRIDRGGTYTYFNLDPRRVQWKEVDGTIDLRGEKKVGFEVIVSPAQGTLAIDDVVVLAK